MAFRTNAIFNSEIIRETDTLKRTVLLVAWIRQDQPARIAEANLTFAIFREELLGTRAQNVALHVLVAVLLVEAGRQEAGDVPIEARRDVRYEGDLDAAAQTLKIRRIMHVDHGRLVHVYRESGTIGDAETAVMTLDR